MRLITKRIKAVSTELLAAAVVLTTLPLSALPAYAAGTGKAMQLVGTGNPSGGIEDQDHIYLWILYSKNNLIFHLSIR